MEPAKGLHEAFLAGSPVSGIESSKQRFGRCPGTRQPAQARANPLGRTAASTAPAGVQGAWLHRPGETRSLGSPGRRRAWRLDRRTVAPERCVPNRSPRRRPTGRLRTRRGARELRSAHRQCRRRPARQSPRGRLSGQREPLNDQKRARRGHAGAGGNEGMDGLDLNAMPHLLAPGRREADGVAAERVGKHGIQVRVDMPNSVARHRPSLRSRCSAAPAGSRVILPACRRLRTHSA